VICTGQLVLWAGKPRFDSQEGKGRDLFVFITVSRPALGCHPVFHPVGSGIFPPGKAAGE
jgi:hypothetical protein